MSSKPPVEEKTADASPTSQTSSSPPPIQPPASITSSPASRHVHHFSRASLDEEAALEEARDTVETDSIQLRQKFDGSMRTYTPGQIGKLDRERAGTLNRLLSQRMDRGLFEDKFLRKEEASESLLNRGSRLNVLLAQRPSKEKLQQMNVIKVAGGVAHSNLTAAQTSLASAQRKSRLQSLIARRPASLDLTRRNILPSDLALPTTNVRTTQSLLQPLIQARPPPSQLLAAHVLQDLPSPGGARHDDVWQARAVGGLIGQEGVRVVCGFAHTLVLTRGGQVFGFGNQTGGRLGRGEANEEDDEEEEEETVGATPRNVRGLEGATAVASGDNHSFAVVKGQLWGWGSGQWGRLGTGSQGDQYSPVHVPLREQVRAVTCGAYHSVVLTQTKGVYAWGWNKQGRVGVGRQGSLLILTPQPITSLSPSSLSSPITGISAGQQHTLAWTEAGGVFSWGGGAHGCLGPWG